MTHVLVRGDGLAAMAAAARLAKAGHQVTLAHDGPLGGRAALRPIADGAPLVDDTPVTTTLPAVWRDLVKKTGRAFAPTMARAGLDLVEPPPALHVFASGRELALPCDRAGQIKAWEQVIGRPAAVRWAELVDDLDQLWQILRWQGAEAPRASELSKSQRERLWADRTIGDLGERLNHPDLHQWLTSTAILAGCADAQRAPALLATRCTLERTFGRWVVVNAHTHLPMPMGTLTELLSLRLDERGVRVVDLRAPQPDEIPQAGAVVDATLPEPPAPARRWWGGRKRLPLTGWAPTIHHDIETDQRRELLPQASATDLVEVVDHTPGSPQVSWHRPRGDGTCLVTTHDWDEPRRDLRWGWTIASFDDWLARPDRPGPASPAGNEPWAELLSGALASYAVHEQLTGDDIRPTNPDTSGHRKGDPRLVGWGVSHVTEQDGRRS